MKSISLDFANNMACVMTEAQQGTEYVPELDKEKFYPYIPEKYREHTSFTWNFETETFIVNQDCNLVSGAIMTEDSFIPRFFCPMKGLNIQFDTFLELMNFEPFSTMDIFTGLIEEIMGMTDDDENEGGI